MPNTASSLICESTVLRLTLNFNGSNLCLLEDTLFALRSRGVSTDILFRLSDGADLWRVLQYGTDRGGYSGNKPWRYNAAQDMDLPHEDVIIATTADEIREGEQDPEISSSFKKIPQTRDPVLLIYARDHIARLHEKHYVFRDPIDKTDALVAIIHLQHIPTIDGWFTAADGHYYRSLIASLQGGRMVEVGVWQGLSLSYAANAILEHGTELFCVDTWRGSSDSYAQDYRAILAEIDVRGRFCANMRIVGLDYELIEQDSIQAAHNFADQSLDLVFIDASHDQPAVTLDLTAWYPKIKPGGILAGHDYAPDQPGVRAALDTYAASNNLAVVRGGGSIWRLDKPKFVLS